MGRKATGDKVKDLNPMKVQYARADVIKAGANIIKELLGEAGEEGGNEA
jgi:hypothetical protein